MTYKINFKMMAKCYYILSSIFYVHYSCPYITFTSKFNRCCMFDIETKEYKNCVLYKNWEEINKKMYLFFLHWIQNNATIS